MNWRERSIVLFKSDSIPGRWFAILFCQFLKNRRNIPDIAAIAFYLLLQSRKLNQYIFMSKRKLSQFSKYPYHFNVYFNRCFAI